jgi:hypothetical protein
MRAAAIKDTSENSVGAELVESLRVQLVEVHTRAKLHADRLWQLPFSYIGVVGISFSLMEQRQADNRPIFWLFTFYALLGILTLLAMLGAIEAIKRALAHMIRVEKALGLVPTTKIRPVYQFAPYVAMAVLGLIACIAVCIQLY